MSKRARLLGAAAIGVAAERLVLSRRRATDPEASETFGERRGDRSGTFELDDGARIFFEEIGPEKATSGAIFIHGSACRTDVWHYQMTDLAGRRLLFCDLRGHGRSRKKGKADFSVARLAEDLEAVIRKAGFEEVILVGHSFGGMVALQLCRTRPKLLHSLIKGLVLVNTTHRPPVETIAGAAALIRIERLTRRPLDGLRAHGSRVDLLRKITRPSHLFFWGVYLLGFGRKASARQIDFTYQMLAQTPSDVIFDLLRAYRDYDVTDNLCDISVPALVVSGTCDRITIPEASEYLAEKMPNAELRLFEGCGHMTMFERYEELNSMLEGFMEDVLDRSESIESPPAARTNGKARESQQA